MTAVQVIFVFEKNICDVNQRTDGSYHLPIKLNIRGHVMGHFRVHVTNAKRHEFDTDEQALSVVQGKL